MTNSWEDPDWREDASTSPMSKNSMRERGVTTLTSSPVVTEANLLESKANDKYPGGTYGMNLAIQGEALPHGRSHDPKGGGAHWCKGDRHHTEGDCSVGGAAGQPKVQLQMVGGCGYLCHPPRATQDDGGSPVGWIRDAGLGPGGSMVVTNYLGGRCLSEGNCQNGLSVAAFKALQDNYIKLRGNLHLLAPGFGWKTMGKEGSWIITFIWFGAGDQHHDYHHGAPPSQMKLKRDQHCWEPHSWGKTPWLGTGEHTDCLPHCPTDNLAFYWEQMELAGQAQDFTSEVY